jgi:colicin import membrane protein
MATEDGGNQPQASDEVLSMALADLGQAVEKAPELKPDEIIDKTDDDKEGETEQSEESAEDQAKEDEEKPESEKEEAEDEEPEHDAPTVSKEVFQKRVDKLTAQRKAAEEKAAEAANKLAELEKAKAETEAKLNEAARPVLAPAPDSPLADVGTEAELEQRIASAHSVRRWALTNSDGATIKAADGSEKFIDASEVKQYLIQADDLLTIHAPAKREWLKEFSAAHAPVEQHFPQLFKAGTPENKSYTEYLKKRPNFAREPDRDYVYSMALLGEQKWREMQEANAAKEKAVKKASSVKSETPKAPTPAKPVSTPKSVTKGSSNAAKRVIEGRGSMEDIEALVTESLLG